MQGERPLIVSQDFPYFYSTPMEKLVCQLYL